MQLFVPMLPVYHQYVGNHTHAMDVSTLMYSVQHWNLSSHVSIMRV